MRFQFLTFELDAERRELTAQGNTVDIPPKAMELLFYLINHRDRLISKSELMEKYWTANSSEAALQKTVSQVRKALSINGETASAIKTYHGRGFRFVASVTEFLDPTGDTGTLSGESVLSLGERRLATVVCLRLREHGKSDDRSDDRNSAIERFLSRANAIVAENDGSLLRMTINGFTAAFGQDPFYEDGARHAVHCASALSGIDTERTDLGVSIGIDSGAMNAKDQSDDNTWTLPSSIERGATTLADSAASGEVIVSEAVRGQLQDEIEIAPTQSGFRVVSIAPMRAGIPARPWKRPTQFVGRTAEMTFLATQRDMLLNGTGQALVLSGPAGIGKSRLVSEFLASLDERKLHLLTVQCLPSLSNTPMEPIRSLCKAVSSIRSGSLLEDEIDAALLREIVDGEAPITPALKKLSEHQHRRRSCDVVDRLLQSLGNEKPLILVFEDVHWLDETSKEYLEILLQHIDRKPLMVILTTRPTDASPPTESVIHLSSLGRDESLTVLKDASNDIAISDDDANALVERAAGNPFFIEELALAAQSGGDPAVDLPTTVQAVIAVRIGSLEDRLRTLVFVTAVIGTPAPPKLVAHLVGLSKEALDEQMQTLVRQGFVQVSHSGYSFRHMLINDSAYAMIAPTDLKSLHAEIAGYLEDCQDAELSRPERLAFHHQEAGATDRAVPCWIAASRSALHRSAHQEAVIFARNGLTIIDGSVPEAAQQELDLLMYLAPALIATRGFGAEEVAQAYTRANELNNRVGNIKIDVRVRVGLWINTWVRGKLTESLAHADNLLVLSKKVKDPALSLQAHASLGQVLLHRGELQRAMNHLTLGLSAIKDAQPDTSPSQSSAVSCAAYASWASQLMGRHREALKYLSESRRLTELHDNPFAESIHYALGSETFMFGGDFEGCLIYADRAVELSREHGFAFWLGTGLVMRGWALGRKGEFEPALEAYDEGIAVFEASGAGVQLANWYGLKAETLLKADQPGAALLAAQYALDCAERAEDLFFTPRVHIVAAIAMEKNGKTPAAKGHRNEASKLVRMFGMSDYILDI